MENRGKSIFDKILHGAVNSEDKAALEEAQQHMAELEQKLADAQKQVLANAQRADAAEKQITDLRATINKVQADGQAQLARSQSELQAVKATVTQLEQRALAAEARVKSFEEMQMRAQQQAAAQVAAVEAAKASIIATHTMTADETLSHLSLKYYGHATEPYWRIIYEANKDVIGSNPNKVHAGLVVKIPVLPDAMK